MLFTLNIDCIRPNTYWTINQENPCSEIYSKFSPTALANILRITVLPTEKLQSLYSSTESHLVIFIATLHGIEFQTHVIILYERLI